MDNNSPNTYTANNVYDYSNRNVPNKLLFSVLADASTVKINGVAASSDNEYYYRELTVANADTDTYQNVIIEATKTNAGTGGTDALAKLEFNYDFLDRRVEKIIKDNWTGAATLRT